MSAPMSKKQFMALPKNQRAALLQPKKRRARKPRNPQAQALLVAQVPRRNGQGRKRGRPRQRGGNAVTTAGNMRSFIIPIDEQVALISGTTGFGVAAYSLNPGNATTFPFASRTCQNYERYEFLNLRFDYKPSASVFATVGAQGFVGITGSMDALQAPPSSQQQSEVMHHSQIVETAKSTHLQLPKEFLQTKSARERFFVRPLGLIPGGADPHLYDCGQIFIWTSGQANTNQIGELRVTGSVKLSNPVLEASSSVPPQYNMSSYLQVDTVTALTSTVAAPLPLATVVVNGLGITQATSNFTLPAGNYMATGDVGFIASGNSTVFTGMIRKNGAAFVTNSFGLPSGAYPLWTCTMAAFYVSSDGNDVFDLVATSTFSSGVSTAGGHLTFTSI